MKKFFNSVAVLITMYFPPESSGGSSYAWNRAMIWQKMGFSVFVITGFPSYPSGKVSGQQYKRKLFHVEKIGSLNVIRLRLLELEHTGHLNRFILFVNFVFLTIFYLPKILKIVGKITIVFSMSPILFSAIIGFVYARISKAFFIYDAPDLWPEEILVLKTRFSFMIRIAGKFLAKFAYSVPDIIVTVTDLAADMICDIYKPKVHVYVLPIGVNTNDFPRLSKEASRIELIKKEILPEHLRDKFIILYSGLISRAQRVESLVYAAKELRHEDKIAFLIVGEGEQKQKLEQLKLEHHIDNLYLLPLQPRHLMPAIISMADICSVILSPESVYDIAIPTKFYEYLACCKPILGICKGSLAKIIDSNNIGRTVNPDDTNGIVSIIKEFHDSINLAQNMGKNCETTLQKFSLDTLASDFSEILMKEIPMKGLKR